MDNKLLLLILDGWGLAEPGPGNAISQANITQWPRLLERYPCYPLKAGGPALDLPEGQAGNSELGHRTIGAGQVLPSPYGEVSRWGEKNALATESNPTHRHELSETFDRVKAANSTLHLLGLLSQGTVHSSLEALLDLIVLAKRAGVPKLRLHGFSDGRDTPPGNWPNVIEPLEELLLKCGYPQITTLTGRYFAMDRDNRWERTEKAFRAIAYAEGPQRFLAKQALELNEREEKTEEFCEPAICDLEYEGVKPHDAIFFFNHRPDRLRQLAQAFSVAGFDGFERPALPEGLSCQSFLPIQEGLPVEPMLTIPEPKTTLGELISKAGLTQLRLAESEKFAHVTYFFNGGKEEPFPGERRMIIDSPKVATYDEQPEMSLPKLTEELLKALRDPEINVIVCNIANGDMVGHTGNLEAGIKAAQAVDQALGQIIPVVENLSIPTLITADHGNLEAMLTEDGRVNTAHSDNPVPLVLVKVESNKQYSRIESLADISAAVHALLNIETTFYL